MQTIALPRASQPYGLVFSPDGLYAYVACGAIGQILRLDASSGATLATLDVGRHVRHLSLSADGALLYAPRFVTPLLPGEDTLSPAPSAVFGAELLVVETAGLTLHDLIVLEHHDTTDAENTARGIPNYLGGAAISPDGLSAWVPSKQDNIKRGTGRDGMTLTHDSAVRAITSHVDLGQGLAGAEVLADRIDHDDGGMPSAAAFGPTGNLLFVALEASAQVGVIDVFAGLEVTRFPVGHAPQGVALSPDGLALYVHNFIDRSVMRFDVSALVLEDDVSIPQTHVLPAVASEKLAADVHLGKQFFYDASDPRLALQGYMSCASCHNDGGQDGRVWDFTGFGEGLRNTVDLRGRGGPRARPAPLVRQLRRDPGLRGPDPQLLARHRAHERRGLQHRHPQPAPGRPEGRRERGPRRPGRLSRLARHVRQEPGADEHWSLDAGGPRGTHALHPEELHHLPQRPRGHGQRERAPARRGHTDAGQRHAPRRPAPGLDTPGLKGLWATAPFYHDGSAGTVEAAIANHADGPHAHGAGDERLADYLRQLEDSPGNPAPSCGLGPELVPVMAGLAAWRRRRRTGA